MQDLEYLIMYTDEGIPIYSRCFGSICKVSMENPILFSGLLASLNQMAAVDSQSRPDTIDLEGELAQIEYTGDHVAQMELDDLSLVFHYATGEDITIAGGMRSSAEVGYEPEQVLQVLLDDVEQYMEQYGEVEWQSVSNDLLLKMEAGLLNDVVYPFFNQYDISDSCPLGDNCPYRLALYEGEGVTMTDKLKHKIGELRQASIWQKLKLKLFSTKYPLSN